MLVMVVLQNQELESLRLLCDVYGGDLEIACILFYEVAHCCTERTEGQQYRRAFTFIKHLLCARTDPHSYANIHIFFCCTIFLLYFFPFNHAFLSDSYLKSYKGDGFKDISDHFQSISCVIPYTLLYITKNGHLLFRKQPFPVLS